jgi:hypothetical protein
MVDLKKVTNTMWVCLNDGFLSVVTDKTDSSRLLVRARRKVDLVNVVGPNAKIEHTPANDYHWRTYIPREEFKQLMMDRIDGIDYTNFKQSVKSEDLHDLYLGFWTDHRNYQRSAETKKKDRAVTLPGDRTTS